MVVLGGETGMRSIEIRNLDAFGRHRDLFYEKGLIQTRYGKGTNGSGYRVRKIIFTELAQATMYPYEEVVRPRFPNALTNPSLFLSDLGLRISYAAMRYALKRIVEEAIKAGLNLPPDMSWHLLRKAFATNYIEREPDKIWLLMEFMGHINPCTLHCYVKHSSAYVERVVRSVAGVLLPPHALIKRRRN
jgi:site-specific recombinase XerD